MQGRLSASAILYRRLLAGSSLRREERARRCRRFCWGRALARLFVFASAFRFLATRHRPSQSMVRHVAKGLPPSVVGLRVLHPPDAAITAKSHQTSAIHVFAPPNPVRRLPLLHILTCRYSGLAHLWRSLLQRRRATTSR